MQITSDLMQAVARDAGTTSGSNTSTNSSSSTGSSSSSSSSSSGSVDSMANEQTFLKLLVAQIQNQDPMQPTDSMQFVGQLAQFSSLEQLIGINQKMSTLSTQLTPDTTTNSNGSTGTNPTPGQ